MSRSRHPNWDNVPTEEIPFPIGPEDDFYAWMLEQFELPPGTPITHRFFRVMRVLELPKAWYRQHQIEDDMNGRWRTRIARMMTQGQGPKEMPRQWQLYPLSALGYHAFTSRIYKIYGDVPGRAALCKYYPEQWGPQMAAELVLRRDIEIRGRARVARDGAAPYLELLNQSPTVSAHEKLETVERWHDLKLFEPRDSEFCARFPQILEEHKKWLANRNQGERAVLCGRDLREVSWPKGALRGADLRGALLRNLDLSGEDFRDCDLRWADLTAARLVGCRWAGANLDEALLGLALVRDVGPLWILRDINLWPPLARMLRRSVSLESQVDWGNDFSDCDLRGRELGGYGKGFGDLNFSDSDLRGADLSRGDFTRYRFDGADLRGANLWGANFRNCSFASANLNEISGAEHAQWNDDPPANRDFRGTHWRGSKLDGRNFAGCDFSGADLRGAHLQGADFTGAILRDADLRGAAGANLEKTRLQGADLTGTRVSKKALGAANLE